MHVYEVYRPRHLKVRARTGQKDTQTYTDTQTDAIERITRSVKTWRRASWSRRSLSRCPNSFQHINAR